MNSKSRGALVAPLAVVLMTGLTGGTTALATVQAVADDARENAEPVRDAYLKGRVVSALALNPHISVFDLEVRVENGIAYMQGAVDTAVERDIAVEVARGVEGIRDVRSAVKIKPGTRHARETQAQAPEPALDDAAMTAKVKAQLLANKETSGTAVDVTTRTGIVTLSGQVGSEAEKDLVERVARNTEGVIEVRNHLTVQK